MKRKSVLARCALLSLFVATAALAQPAGDVKILLPLVVEDPIPGAYGSLWATRISLLNTADRDIVIDGYMLDTCQTGCGPFRPTPPGITFTPQFATASTEVEGYFLYTNATDEPFVNLQIHAQDLSRQSLTWGTEIPAVAENDAFTSRIDLVNVPIGDRFRSRLRVYDFAPSFTATARIGYRVYAVREELRYPWVSGSATKPPVSADLLLASGELRFAVATLGYFGRPGFALLDVDSLPEVSGQQRVRIELFPLTEGLRYWAFVSVTNNETQHITTITPR